jgi:acetylcholinesterase/cholinesterase
VAFFGFPTPLSYELYNATLISMFGQEDAQKILTQPRYQGDQNPNANNTSYLNSVFTDYLFTCSNRYIVHHAKQEPYVYQFTHVSSFDIWQNLPIHGVCKDNVCHGDELPYVFHSADRIGVQFTRAEADLSDHIAAYWSGFATTLNPNHRTHGTLQATIWPAFSPPQGRYFILNVRSMSQDDPFADICHLWDQIGYGPKPPLGKGSK